MSPSRLARSGSWALEGNEGGLPANHGALRLDEFSLVESAEELASRLKAEDTAAALALSGASGGGPEASAAAAATGAAGANAGGGGSVLPAAGAAGNEACGVSHVASVAVPCSVCGADDGESSRLAFFDLTIPHFGSAELVSFSCSDCGYKFNKVFTTDPPNWGGVSAS